MIYRRKTYRIASEIVEEFNGHFNETLLPAQLKYGSRLVGRWVAEERDGAVELFAIWEYDSQEDYERIESQVRDDKEHLSRVQAWFNKIGKDRIRNVVKAATVDEMITAAVPRDKTILR